MKSRVICSQLIPITRLVSGLRRGFSLVELAIVALVMLAFLSIAIPTFLGTQTSAQDRTAQSLLRSALTNAEILRGGGQSPTDSALDGLEPNIDFVPAATPATAATATTRANVSVTASGTGSAFVFKATALSESGNCYIIRKTGAAGIFYGSIAAANCNAGNAGIDAASTRRNSW